MKQKKLTVKQRKFLKEYFKTGNGTQSAIKVYDVKDAESAAALASETLSKLKEPIKTLMEQKGISLGRLMDVLDDGLGANRVISAVNTNKQADGATSDFIEVPDHAVRHKYLETAAKWLGMGNNETIGAEFKKGDESVRIVISRGDA
jgi:hypothetical protein